MAEGIPNGHFRIYGYRWEGDELVIVSEEAAVVRRIFQNFLNIELFGIKPFTEEEKQAYLDSLKNKE